jgi:hypothetical protein
MSSISHAVSFHICGGDLQSMAIFGKAQPCEEHDNACHHDGTKHTSIDPKGCCEDATVSIDGDAYKITEKVTVENSQFFFLSLANSVPEVNAYAGLTQAHFSRYRPPLIERDITILVQTFLI